jgi:serine/threonine-protein kinase
VSDERWREVSRLYHHAAALAAADRPAYLRKVCAGDEALRSEIESLLIDNSRVERLLVSEHSRMDLIGRRIGVYEIRSLLGAGGMGEVYRARDTRLDRDVAIKILPPAFTSDPDRLARFEREARLLASLNHPHIAAIYGFEEKSGIPALVLELVDGETLAARLTRGAIPISESVSIARQLVDALDAAHEHGIVHRDLKPANIIFTPGGDVKVLDFGLGKASSTGESHTKQLTVDTRDGVVLGTAAYMSPEQARGKPVDKRTDIWAFGCVLYEMLTGKPAFPGDTVSDTISGILDREPEWTALPAAVPTAVKRLLRRCLEKDARRRLRDIADAAGDFSADESTRVDAPQSLSLLKRLMPIGAMGLVAAVLAAATWQFAPQRTPTAAPVSRFSLAMPPSVNLRSDVGQRLAISRDSRFIVYNGARANGRQLYVHSLDQIDSIPIRGTEVADGEIGSLFLSPDGEWVGFWDVRTSALRKIRVTGGQSVMICELPGEARFTTATTASWSRSGVIVFSSTLRPGLFKVADEGGVPEPLTQPPAGTTHRQPHVLPDGKAVLFTIQTPQKPPMLAVLSLETGEQKLLVEGTLPRATTNSHLVFQRSGRLWSIGFDPVTLAINGQVAPVLEDTGNFANAGNYDISENGTLIYSRTEAKRMLVWVDRQGREEPLPVPPKTYIYPRISPNGTRVVLDVRNDVDSGDIWMLDLQRAALSLLVDLGNERHPIWSRDGSRVLFATIGSGPSNSRLYSHASDGTGAPDPIIPGAVLQLPLSFSPDGKYLLTRAMGFPNWNLNLLSMADRRVSPLVADEFFETNGEISPDGRWIAYEARETSRRDVFVRPFPNVEKGRRSLVSPEGGSQPLWSRSGRELFYLDPDGRLTAVNVQPSPSFAASTPVRLLDRAYLYHSVPFPARTYDVSPDGSRFLMIKEADGPRLVVVLNWAATLKGR